MLGIGGRLPSFLGVRQDYRSLATVAVSRSSRVFSSTALASDPTSALPSTTSRAPQLHARVSVLPHISRSSLVSYFSSCANAHLAHVYQTRDGVNHARSPSSKSLYTCRSRRAFPLARRPGILHAACAYRATCYAICNILQPPQLLQASPHRQHAEEQPWHSAERGAGARLRLRGVLHQTAVQQLQNVDAEQQLRAVSEQQQQQAVGKRRLQQEGRDTAQLQHFGKQRKQRFVIQRKLHVLEQRDRETVAHQQQLAVEQHEQPSRKQQQHVLMQQEQQQPIRQQTLSRHVRLWRTVSFQQRRRFSASCSRSHSSSNRGGGSATGKNSAASVVLCQAQQVAELRKEQQHQGQTVQEDMRQQLRCIYTPVLIIGGGPVGLSFALLLRRMGVPCVVVEKEQNAGCQPKAHYCSNRSMEVWRVLEHLDEELDEATPSLDDWRHFSYCTQLVPSVKDKLSHIAVRDHFEDHYTYTTSDGKKRYFEVFSPCKVGHVPQHIVLPLLYSRVYEAAAAASSSSCPPAAPAFPSSSVPGDHAATPTAAAFSGRRHTFAAAASSLFPPASAPVATGASSSQGAVPLYTRLFNEPLPRPSLSLLPPSTRQRLLRLWSSSSSGNSRNNSEKRNDDSSSDSHSNSTARKVNGYSDADNTSTTSTSSGTSSTSPGVDSTSASVLCVPKQRTATSNPPSVFLGQRQQLLCLTEDPQQQHQKSNAGTTESSRLSSRASQDSSPFPAAAPAAASRSAAGTQQQTNAASCAPGVRSQTSSSPAARAEQRPRAATGVASNQRRQPTTVGATTYREERLSAVPDHTFHNVEGLVPAAMSAASAVHRERGVAAAAVRKPAVAADTQQGQSGEQPLQQLADQQEQLAEAVLPVPEILFGTEWLTAELRETRRHSQAAENDLCAQALSSRPAGRTSSDRSKTASAEAHSRNTCTASFPFSSSPSSSTSFCPGYSFFPAAPSPSASPTSFCSASGLRPSSFEAWGGGEDSGAADGNSGEMHLPGTYIRSLVRHRSKEGVSTPLLIESAFVFACDGAKSNVAASLTNCFMHGVEGEVQHLVNITFSSQHLANLIRSSQYLESSRISPERDERRAAVPAGGERTEVEGSWRERSGDNRTGESSRRFDGPGPRVDGSNHPEHSSSRSRTQNSGSNAPSGCSHDAEAEQSSSYHKSGTSSVAREGNAVAGESRQDLESSSPNQEGRRRSSENAAGDSEEGKTSEEEQGNSIESRNEDVSGVGSKKLEASGRKSEDSSVDGQALHKITYPPSRESYQRSHAAAAATAAALPAAAAAPSSSRVSDESFSFPYHSPPSLSPVSASSPLPLPLLHAPPSSPASSPPPRSLPLPPLQPSCASPLPEGEGSAAAAAAASASPTSRSCSAASSQRPLFGGPNGTSSPFFSPALSPVAAAAPAPPLQRQPYAGKRRSASPPSMLYYVMNERVVGVVVLHSLARGEFVAHIPYFPVFTSPSVSVRKAHSADSSSVSLPSCAASQISSLAAGAAGMPDGRIFSYSPACGADVPNKHATGAFSSTSPSHPLPSPSASLRPLSPGSPSSSSSSFTPAGPLLSREAPAFSHTAACFPASHVRHFYPDRDAPLVNSEPLSETLLLDDDPCTFNRISNFPPYSKTTTRTQVEEEWKEAVQHLAGVPLRDLRIFEARGWRMAAKVANSFVFASFPAASSFRCSPRAAPAAAADGAATRAAVAFGPVSSFFSSSDSPSSSFSPAAAATTSACCAGTTRFASAAAPKNVKPPAGTEEAAKQRAEGDFDPQPRSSQPPKKRRKQKQVRQEPQQQLLQHLLQADEEQQNVRQTPREPGAQRQRMRQKTQQQQPPQQVGTEPVAEVSSAAPVTQSSQASSEKNKTTGEEEKAPHTGRNPIEKSIHCDTHETSPTCNTVHNTVATVRSLPRIVLLGDAAHQLPPAGGLGMNLGIGDAVALAWRIAQLYHRGFLLNPNCSSNGGHESSRTSTYDNNSRENNSGNRSSTVSSRGQSERGIGNRDCNSSREGSSDSSISESCDSKRSGGGSSNSSSSKGDSSGRKIKTHVDTTTKWEDVEQVENSSSEKQLGHLKTAAASASHVETWWRLLKSFDEERRLVAMYACSVAVDNFQRGLEVPAALGLDLRLGDKISGTLLAAAAAAENVASTCVDWLQPETFLRKQGTTAADAGATSPAPTVAAREAPGAAVAELPAAAAGGFVAAAARTVAGAAAAVGLSAAANAAAAASKAASRDKEAIFSSFSTVKEKVTEVPLEIARRTFDAVVAVAKNQVTLCRKWIPLLWERRRENVERILKNENKNLGMLYYGVDLAYAYASSVLYVHSLPLLAPALVRKSPSPVRGLSAAERVLGEGAGNAAAEAAAGRGGAATAETADAAAAEAGGGSARPAQQPATLMVSRSPFHYEPTSWIGCRVPHTWLYCAVENQQGRQETAYRFSTVDLPFIHYPSCAYCFLVFSSRHVHTLQQALFEAAKEKFSCCYTPESSRPAVPASGDVSADGTVGPAPAAAPAALSSARASSAVPSTTFLASPLTSSFSLSSVPSLSASSYSTSSPASGTFSSSKATIGQSAADTAKWRRLLRSLAFVVCWEPTAVVAADATAAPAAAFRADEREKTFLECRPFALPGGLAALQLLGVRSAAAAAPREAPTECDPGAEAAAEAGDAASCHEHRGDTDCTNEKIGQEKQLLQHHVLSEGVEREGLQTCGPQRDLTLRRKKVSGKESSFACEKKELQPPVDTRFVWSSEKRREAFLAAMEKEILKRLQLEQRPGHAAPLNREDFLVVLRPDAHILAISYIGEDLRAALPSAAAPRTSTAAPSAAVATAAGAPGETSAPADRTDARLASVVADVMRRLP